MNPEDLPDDIWERILKDPVLRRNLARGSHHWFFTIYLPHYVKYRSAPFHKELFTLTEDTTTKLAVVVAFRGSGKSTIMTLSYPIWAIIGCLEKKFVLLLSQTQQQARQHLINIKRELEGNDLLREELGPFEEPDDEWGSQTLVIPKHGARIMAASTEQSIRGVRHRAHRPDLIICDDVEDMTSVKTREGRDKTYSWLTGEILPAGDEYTKTILIGNLLHEDSLLMRLKAGIDDGKLDGVFRSYPLVTPDDQILWPGKFPDLKTVEAFRRRLGNEIAWRREYLLQIVPDDYQLVPPDWIQYAPARPGKESEDYRYTAIGVDLAISQRATADCTAVVVADVHGSMDKLRVYIHPHPINQRLSFPEALEKIKQLATSFGSGHAVKLFIEDVGYQPALIQELNRIGIRAEGVKVHGQDKRSRLALSTHLIQSGKVLFPEKGTEHLVQQLTGLGVEKHDDLADAYSLLMIKVMEDNKPGPRILWI